MANKNVENKSCFRTSIGGQALIEGILMRGPEKQAIVCRTENGLVEKVENVKLKRGRHKILNVPLIRGSVVFLDSMINGTKALTYSASLMPLEEQGEKSKLDETVESKFDEETAKNILITISVIFGILFSLLLFVVLPTTIVNFIKPLSRTLLLRNFSEGVVKVVILVAYMWAVSKTPDIKRLFQYHGAEHKTIFCYEHRKELAVENVRREKRFHPRCGTSFLLVVVLVSILVNAMVQITGVLPRIVVHLLLVPVVVGISYEINRWCGGHDNWLSTVLSAPGKWLQRITTNEPDEEMIECAIRAMKLVIPEDEASATW